MLSCQATRLTQSFRLGQLQLSTFVAGGEARHCEYSGSAIRTRLLIFGPRLYESRYPQCCLLPDPDTLRWGCPIIDTGWPGFGAREALIYLRIHRHGVQRKMTAYLGLVAHESR